jgi:hypothetical protein
MNEYDLIDVTISVLDQARGLIQRYPLKAYDEVQLASAKLADAALHGAGIGALIFLTGDRQLLTAAATERLMVDNPSLHP